MQFTKLPYDRVLNIATHCLEVKKVDQIVAILGELQALLDFDVASLIGVRFERGLPRDSGVICPSYQVANPLGLCSETFKLEDYPVLIKVLNAMSETALYSYQSLHLDNDQGILFGYRNNGENQAALLYLYEKGRAGYYPYKLMLNHLMSHLNHAVQQVLQRRKSGIELSDREYEVLRWLREGKSNWEISRILQISEHTVKYHVSNLYRKLEVTNRGQAVGKAVAEEII